MITANLILASLNDRTNEILYTFAVRYPRIILPEVNTHRMFSRNTASSRAKPAKVIRHQVLHDPFLPLHIGRNQRGMQAGKEFTGVRFEVARRLYGAARYPALAAHLLMEKFGVHKQITNRLIEPWVWVDQLISATDWGNFLFQRTHHAAEPHMQQLANLINEEIYEARVELKHMRTYGGTVGREGTLRILQHGEWHLPFISLGEQAALGIEDAKKVSAARCARVSYKLPDTGETSTLNRDLELYDRLALRVDNPGDPRHLSPLEHPAQAQPDRVYYGNFFSFKQLRKFIPNEDGQLLYIRGRVISSRY